MRSDRAVELYNANAPSQGWWLVTRPNLEKASDSMRERGDRSRNIIHKCPGFVNRLFSLDDKKGSAASKNSGLLCVLGRNPSRDPTAQLPFRPAPSPLLPRRSCRLPSREFLGHRPRTQPLHLYIGTPSPGHCLYRHLQSRPWSLSSLG